LRGDKKPSVQQKPLTPKLLPNAKQTPLSLTLLQRMQQLDALGILPGMSTQPGVLNLLSA
jgi:hypothetical protein